MTKVVIRKMENNTARKLGVKQTNVTKKRVRTKDGKITTIHVVDGNSSTLSADLTYVFGRNVARARRENKRLLGVEDIEPERG